MSVSTMTREQWQGLIKHELEEGTARDPVKGALDTAFVLGATNAGEVQGHTPCVAHMVVARRLSVVFEIVKSNWPAKYSEVLANCLDHGEPFENVVAPALVASVVRPPQQDVKKMLSKVKRIIRQAQPAAPSLVLSHDEAIQRAVHRALEDVLERLDNEHQED